MNNQIDPENPTDNHSESIKVQLRYTLGTDELPKTLEIEEIIRKVSFHLLEVPPLAEGRDPIRYAVSSAKVGINQDNLWTCLHQIDLYNRTIYTQRAADGEDFNKNLTRNLVTGDKYKLYKVSINPKIEKGGYKEKPLHEVNSVNGEVAYYYTVFYIVDNNGNVIPFIN